MQQKSSVSESTKVPNGTIPSVYGMTVILQTVVLLHHISVSAKSKNPYGHVTWVTQKEVFSLKQECYWCTLCFSVYTIKLAWLEATAGINHAPLPFPFGCLHALLLFPHTPNQKIPVLQKWWAILELGWEKQRWISLSLSGAEQESCLFYNFYNNIIIWNAILGYLMPQKHVKNTKKTEFSSKWVFKNNSFFPFSYQEAKKKRNLSAEQNLFLVFYLKPLNANMLRSKNIIKMRFYLSYSKRN